jgi:hypothetical protein
MLCQALHQKAGKEKNLSSSECEGPRKLISTMLVKASSSNVCEVLRFARGQAPPARQTGRGTKVGKLPESVGRGRAASQKSGERNFGKVPPASLSTFARRAIAEHSALGVPGLRGDDVLIRVQLPRAREN